jgi:type I restriction-modification system DNA methylase subunit
MARESFIDSEIYRFFKNLQEQNIDINGLTIQDVKFHYPVDGGETDIYLVMSYAQEPFSIVIETKRKQIGEFFDPYSPRVIGQALGYAKFMASRFIITSNGDLFLCFDITENLPILQCIVNEDIKLAYSETYFLQFLTDLEKYLAKKKPLKTLSERFIERLAYFHQVLTPYFSAELSERIKDQDFNKKFRDFCKKRQYASVDDTNLVRWIAEQSAYLLLNRLLFHGVLQNYYQDVPEIKRIDGISVDQFIEELNKTFQDTVHEINYRIIFRKANIFDEIPISTEMAYLLNEFIEELDQYNIALINEDVIGKVSELIIPEIDKHLQGQYYTPQWIANLIAELVITNADMKILDTSCGSGTFLISAHDKLKEFGNSHSKIIDQITGIDINYFPAHLAALNLIIRDITQKHDNLKILPIDFFKIRAQQQLVPLNYLTITDEEADRSEAFQLTPDFDAVITNPPYTEAREIGDDRYKKIIRKAALSNEKQLAKSIGIYGYFYTHANHFLKNRGQIGFIVSNSFLETKGGASLCKFFLSNFKIKYLISFTKNVFPYADVKAIITILEKCSNKPEREQNTVKFVKVLTHYSKLDVKNFAQQIEGLTKDYADAKFSLVQVSQKDLETEPSWMLYFRDYVQISLYLRVFGQKLPTLATVCGLDNIRSCFKAGGYEFFIMKKEDNTTLQIEPSYLENIIHSPKDFSKLSIKEENVKKYLLKIESLNDLMKTKSNAKNYLKIWMKKEIPLKKGKGRGRTVTGIQNTPTFLGKATWYRVFDGQLRGNLLFQGYVNRSIKCFINECGAYSSANYVTIKVVDPNLILLLALIYNSSLMHFYLEIKGTVLGANALYIANYQLSESRVPLLQNLPEPTIEQAKILFDQYKETDFASPEFVELQKQVDELVFDLYGVSAEDRITLKKELDRMVARRLKGKK